MKKFILLSILGFFVVSLYAQKESGIVYSEHDGITKTKALWAAFVKGDKETYLSFYADSVWNGNNGKMERITKEQFGRMMDWWNKEFKNLAMTDDKPATPDALEYKEGGLWVQDWMKLIATHEKSGINLNWAVHDVYHFNKDGKIDILLQYYDPTPFTELNNSGRTIENGTVYINHPYIVTVRKLVNAWCNEDIETLKKYYSPKAVFTDLSSKAGIIVSLEEKMNRNRTTFASLDNIKLEQYGYPDCIYYAKDDNYTVYSWWTLSFTNKEGKKYTDIPVMLSHMFDKEGKIAAENIYLSSNHLE